MDRFSKIYIISKIPLHKSINIISNFFSITYVKNTGAAWSILSGNRLFLIIVGVIVLVMFIYYIFKEKNITLIESVSYGLIFSGITGNLIDRVFYGYVIDFFDFYIFGYDFPIFNIADTLIVVGVIIYIFSCKKRGVIDEGNN